MICVGLMYRRQNLEPTRTVGARAASWGLTHLLATLLFLGLHFYLLFALDGTEAADSFFPIGIPITIWLLISVLHIDWRAVDMMEILALTLPSSRGPDPTIDREHQEKHKQKPAEHEEDERTIEH